MKVSIVMSAYNTAKYIDKAIECIIAQTYTDWELIISDDCSTDNTVEVVRRYLDDKRIKLHQHPKNLGMVRNKNYTQRQATGALVTQLDSDDLCPPDRLEKQVGVFLKHPETMMCGTDYMMIDAEGNALLSPEYTTHRKYKEDTIITELALSYPFWFPGVMWKKELFKEIGYLPEYFNGIYGDDHYWTMKGIQKYSLYFLNECLYYYRTNPTSVTNVLDNKRKLIAQDIIAELHRQITETGTDWIERGKPEEGLAYEESLYKNKQLMATRYRTWAAKAIDKNNWQQAVELLKKHFQNSITDVSGYRTLLYYIRRRYFS